MKNGVITETNMAYPFALLQKGYPGQDVLSRKEIEAAEKPMKN